MTTTPTRAATATVDPVWTIHDVAAYLRVPVETLYTWRKHRTGPPASRIGRHLRYDPAEVRAWFRQQQDQDQAA